MAGISLPYGVGDLVWTKGGIGAAPVSRKVVSVYFIHGSTMVELEAPGQPVVKAAAGDVYLTAEAATAQVLYAQLAELNGKMKQYLDQNPAVAGLSTVRTRADSNVAILAALIQ